MLKAILVKILNGKKYESFINWLKTNVSNLIENTSKRAETSSIDS